jgi:hypothetical protein
MSSPGRDAEPFWLCHEVSSKLDHRARLIRLLKVITVRGDHATYTSKWLSIVVRGMIPRSCQTRGIPQCASCDGEFIEIVSDSKPFVEELPPRRT